MCGICGIATLSSDTVVDKNTVQRMNNTLTHRGPDDGGTYCDDNVVLAMRRLSVIDLSTGQQPIHNEDKTIWIVFNGEIYNYRALRKDLKGRGHKFYTNTDTETIVHLYEEYAEKSFDKLNGMFAFALWDSIEKKLLLVRDRLGVKPLYYAIKGKRLFFASEIKALIQAPDVSRELNLKALDYYFTFLSIPAPLSIFKDIEKLLPGHFITVKKGKATFKRYWNKLPDVPFGNKTDYGEEYYISNIRKLLIDAVRLRLISDVPLGAFLSGGIDSSTIVGLMAGLTDRPVKTFSIGFEEDEANELEYARIIARQFGTDHHEFIVKPNIVQLLEELVWYFDEPFAVSSALPTYLLSKLTREHVTVTLTGDGADELFAGYPRYWWDKTSAAYSLLPVWIRKSIIWPAINALPSSTHAPAMNTIRRLKKYAKLGALSPSGRYTEYLSFFNVETKKGLYSNDFKAAVVEQDPVELYESYLQEVQGKDLVTQRLYLDLKTSLPDEMLMKVDRMSMANSLEARTPFLDYRLVEFAMDIPSRFKLKGCTLKYILKKAVSDLLPRKIILRPKHGFHVPLNTWMRSELKDFCEQTLSEENLRKHGLFNTGYVRKLLRKHQDGRENLGHHLWSLIVFDVWHKNI